MRPYYMDELKLSNAIESHGFYKLGRHVLVDSAFCSGLRRDGVRSDSWVLDKYWHFNCDAFDSHDGSWTLKLKTVSRPGRATGTGS
jgi:hypothetical protein